MTQTRRQQRAEPPSLFLRITHPSIDPVAITSTLEVEPEYATQAGQSISAQGVKKVHSQSYWLASLPLLSMAELLAEGRSGQPDALPTRESIVDRYREMRQLTKGLDLFGLQLLRWLRKLESQRAFIMRIVAEDGTITLVVQRDDRDVPFNLAPGLARQVAELEISLEIE